MNQEQLRKKKGFIGNPISITCCYNTFLRVTWSYSYLFVDICSTRSLCTCSMSWGSMLKEDLEINIVVSTVRLMVVDRVLLSVFEEAGRAHNHCTFYLVICTESLLVHTVMILRWPFEITKTSWNLKNSQIILSSTAKLNACSYFLAQLIMLLLGEI